MLALAPFELVDGGRRAIPIGSRALLLTEQGGAWRASTLEDPQSELFHEVLEYAPPGEGPGLLTLGGRRAAVKLLPWEVGHMAPYQMTTLAQANEEIPAWLLVVACLALAAAGWFLISLWSPSGRTPYDRLCGTRVELLRPDPALTRAP